MNVEFVEATWLEHEGSFTILELAELSGLSADELRELAGYDAFSPAREGGAAAFSAECLVTAGIAQRLRRAFELDTASLALVLTLLDRIRALETQIRALEARLPRPIREP
jgi:hypothetical protein